MQQKYTYIYQNYSIPPNINLKGWKALRTLCNSSKSILAIQISLISHINPSDSSVIFQIKAWHNVKTN